MNQLENQRILLNNIISQVTRIKIVPEIIKRLFIWKFGLFSANSDHDFIDEIIK